MGSQVDNTEEQSVKDQQCGLVSIKKHVTERVSFIYWEKMTKVHLSYTKTTKGILNIKIVEAVTIVKYAFVNGFKKLHPYDSLQRQFILDYVVHLRVRLR